MKRILLVEDDQNIAELERDYLEINEFEVTTCYDGESGLREGLKGDYQLIILDVMLPHLTGFDVCKRLREQIDTPILMVSAKKEDIDKIRALGLGADDYITKPFSPGELVARVKSHLARFERLTNHKENHHQIVIRDIALDAKSHKVFVSGEEITLTTKEFELLKFLMQNKNQVFNKEELFEKIWGLDAFGDTSTVVVHMKRIREKIELDSKNPTYVETIWGSGYRFNE
ncbi:DNA-binding response regulator [Listeria fleischmannii 1991]|uniref:Sensory transduction protein regX3 n=2 Tax=Listeria fleischmannii TaxID=1069827 RepID=A0A2X3GG78_9LIST|nr:response regulator transcription factor [Listeria fleischmannii]EMG28494.1 DNA-binding response regulator [Listeria fleischmannii subsp. fleischmannii LU2006-1]KMT59767.1 DNA-binding response regulator [Listeria fleischmannii 1991]SQC67128.1 Sensory transduction protein regX3 [Listeria fleischmannii subsp. fleischmannii]